MGNEGYVDPGSPTEVRSVPAVAPATARAQKEQLRAEAEAARERDRHHLSGLRPKQLRELCRERDFPTHGSEDQLRARLLGEVEPPGAAPQFAP